MWTRSLIECWLSLLRTSCMVAFKGRQNLTRCALGRNRPPTQPHPRLRVPSSLRNWLVLIVHALARRQKPVAEPSN
ncbi:hypothetical protein EV126DRAFT_433908 [Verticillium dahliae]|nr:hypothetical protein EV126DRAFT_433908 [Verticillium dahliae]